VRGAARRLLRHLSLAALFFGGTLLVYALVREGPPAQRLSVATAYVGLAFLAATLVVGPLNERRQRPNPVSTNLRRDIGIWAALGGIAHTIVGFQVHMGGEIVRYFVPDASAMAVSKSAIAFLLANYTGLGATLLLVVLLAISNDLALRKLGPGRWKRIQRLNYVLFGLVVAHGVLYLAVDKASWVRIVPFILLVVFVSQVQMQGRLSKARVLRSRQMSEERDDEPLT
jgi:sulfoxide reductase heme-binding subunit YedZ